MSSLITLLASAVTRFFDLSSAVFLGAVWLVGGIFSGIVGFVALIGNSIVAVFSGAIQLVVDVINATAVLFLVFIRLGSALFGELLKFTALIGNTVFKGLSGIITLAFGILKAPFKGLQSIGKQEALKTPDYVKADQVGSPPPKHII